MIRSFLCSLVLLTLSACAGDGRSDQSIKPPLVLPVIMGMWTNIPDPGAPGLLFDRHKPEIHVARAHKNGSIEILDTMEYKVIAHDDLTQTSYIAVKSKGTFWNEGNDVYHFNAIRYLPFGGYPRILIKDTAYCGGVRFYLGEIWHKFDQKKLARLVEAGEPCNYDFPVEWSGQSPYGRY